MLVVWISRVFGLTNALQSESKPIHFYFILSCSKQSLAIPLRATDREVLDYAA